jgi:hypothetical protein
MADPTFINQPTLRSSGVRLRSPPLPWPYARRRTCAAAGWRNPRLQAEEMAGSKTGDVFWPIDVIRNRYGTWKLGGKSWKPPHFWWFKALCSSEYGHKLVGYRISRQIQMRIGLRSAHSEHDSELRSPAPHCDTVTVQNRHCYGQVAIDLAWRRHIPSI